VPAVGQVQLQVAADVALACHDERRREPDTVGAAAEAADGDIAPRSSLDLTLVRSCIVGRTADTRYRSPSG
jgi:hypothetical protein